MLLWFGPSTQPARREQASNAKIMVTYSLYHQLGPQPSMLQVDCARRRSSIGKSSAIPFSNAGSSVPSSSCNSLRRMTLGRSPEAHWLMVAPISLRVNSTTSGFEQIEVPTAFRCRNRRMDETPPGRDCICRRALKISSGQRTERNSRHLRYECPIVVAKTRMHRDQPSLIPPGVTGGPEEVGTHVIVYTVNLRTLTAKIIHDLRANKA